MNITVARALLPAAQTGEFNPQEDFRTLVQVARTFQSLTPLVALDSELVEAFRKKLLHTLDERWNGFTLNLSGTDRIHHGVRGAALKVLRYFVEHEIPVRIGIGATHGSAWARSRYGAKHRCADQYGPGYSICGEDVPLDELPVSALRIEPPIVEKLRDVGITTIGLLRRIPRAELGKRYGVRVLQRIDHLLGMSTEPFRTLRVPEPCRVQKRFETPLFSRAGVQQSVSQLFQQLFHRLARRKKRARSFYIECTYCRPDRSKGTVRKEVSLFSAGTDQKRLQSVVGPAIEKLSFEGDVCAISIEAKLLSGVLVRQEGFFARDRAAMYQDAIDDLMNHLVVKLGAAGVRRVALHQSYVPERAFSYQSVLSENATYSKEAVSNGDRVVGRECTKVAESSPAYCAESPIVPHERPSIVFRIPERISAIAQVPDKPPSLIIWNGDRLKIMYGSGPERIEGEWWSVTEQLSSIPQSLARSSVGDHCQGRDYFRVQDEHGRWLWIFRQQGERDWFLQGVWG